MNDQKETAFFLRTGLNPLLEKYQCAAIINHHTPKTTRRDTTNWRPSDWGYAGAGSNDVTNWARAALVIDPTHAHGVFKLIAAKRGRRIGWCNEAGTPIYERHFCHDTDGGIYWREATPDEIQDSGAAKHGRKGADKTKENLKALVPATGAISKTALLSQAQTVGIGEKRARGFLSELLGAGDLHEWRIRRSKTNPEIRISRHEESIS